MTQEEFSSRVRLLAQSERLLFLLDTSNEMLAPWDAQNTRTRFDVIIESKFDSYLHTMRYNGSSGEYSSESEE